MEASRAGAAWRGSRRGRGHHGGGRQRLGLLEASLGSAPCPGAASLRRWIGERSTAPAPRCPTLASSIPRNPHVDLSAISSAPRSHLASFPEIINPGGTIHRVLGLCLGSLGACPAPCAPLLPSPTSGGILAEPPARAVTPAHSTLTTAQRHPPKHNPLDTLGGDGSIPQRGRAGDPLGSTAWDPLGSGDGLHWGRCGAGYWCHLSSANPAPEQQLLPACPQFPFAVTFLLPPAVLQSCWPGTPQPPLPQIWGPSPLNSPTSSSGGGELYTQAFSPLHPAPLRLPLGGGAEKGLNPLTLPSRTPHTCNVPRGRILQTSFPLQTRPAPRRCGASPGARQD